LQVVVMMNLMFGFRLPNHVIKLRE